MAGRKLRLFVSGGPDIVDAVVSRSEGGAKLVRGIRELASSSFPDAEVETLYERTGGFADLRVALETGDSRILDEQPQVVVLSIGSDVLELDGMGTSIEDGVRRIEADLVAVIDLIKEKVGAHVLVANASTLDPIQSTFNYHDIDDEPVSLRAHRLDLMLVGVSHTEGISVIDVDRKIAELGGVTGVLAALDYSEAGCRIIAEEIVRVIEDYGFFDDRPLLVQVGASAGAS
ncbi:MAG: hypothetical protein ABFR53_03670 [Actinomycetota bacterium]